MKSGRSGALKSDKVLKSTLDKKIIRTIELGMQPVGPSACYLSTESPNKHAKLVKFSHKVQVSELEGSNVTQRWHSVYGEVVSGISLLFKLACPRGQKKSTE